MTRADEIKSRLKRITEEGERLKGVVEALTDQKAIDVCQAKIKNLRRFYSMWNRELALEEAKLKRDL